MQERIKELVNILNKANYEYHVLDNPTITDQEFDKYLRELTELEMEYPELKRDNSPTLRVGGQVIDGFEKVNAIVIGYGHISCRAACRLPHTFYLLYLYLPASTKTIRAACFSLICFKILTYTVYMLVLYYSPHIIFKHIYKLNYVLIKILHTKLYTYRQSSSIIIDNISKYSRIRRRSIFAPYSKFRFCSTLKVITPDSIFPFFKPQP